MTDTLEARFLRYVQIDTQSNARSEAFPSTASQWNLLKLLRAELLELGVKRTRLTKDGYVIARFPATKGRAKSSRVALFAHVDTAPDFSGSQVKPIVHRRYDGRAIRFPNDRKLVLDARIAPDLAQAKGKDVITASGDTLLGADDKAGVAVLMTLAEILVKDKTTPHGEVTLCFTPDEEIGRGVDKLDIPGLGADVGYTLDGGSVGEICWETFSADAAEVVIRGVSTHPGEARAKGMINAVALAARLLMSIPRERCAPESTRGREGFIHPIRVEASAERASLKFILRDFELKGLAQKRAILEGLCAGLRAAEPGARIDCSIQKQYRNMAYWLRKDMRPVIKAREAVLACGLQVLERPVRGGTDGSRLTEEGLPTPNLFTGMHNIHSPLEWVAVQDMELSVKVCRKLIELWSESSR